MVEVMGRKGDQERRFCSTRDIVRDVRRGQKSWFFTDVAVRSVRAELKSTL